MSKFIYSFDIILLGLSLEYSVQISVRPKLIKLPIHPDDLRKLLQRIALLFFNQVAIVGAIWGVSLKKAVLVALPFIGLMALLAGGGLPRKVVIILSSMPVAFNALIPPSIYDLDLDPANSCWFFTTAMLIVVLPFLRFVLRLILTSTKGHR